MITRREVTFAGGPLDGQPYAATGVRLPGSLNEQGERVSLTPVALRAPSYANQVRETRLVYDDGQSAATAVLLQRSEYVWRPPYEYDLREAAEVACPKCSALAKRGKGSIDFACTSCSWWEPACIGCGKEPRWRSDHWDLCTSCRAGEYAHLVDQETVEDVS